MSINVEYIDNIIFSLPFLSDEDRLLFDALFTLEDLLMDTNTNKVLGADGLPVEMYKQYGGGGEGVLLTELLKVFNTAFDKGTLTTICE